MDNFLKDEIKLIQILSWRSEIQGIRYFDIVSVDDLLERLALECDPIAGQLCRLLLNSFFPLGQEEEDAETRRSQSQERLSRFCVMVRKNPNGTKEFYRRLHLLAPLRDCCRLLKALYLSLVREPLFPSGERENCASSSESRVASFEIVAGLWISLAPSLQRQENNDHLAYLCNAFTEESIAGLLEKGRECPQSQNALWSIAAHISRDSIPQLMNACSAELDEELKRDSPICLPGILRACVQWEEIMSVLELLGGRFQTLSNTSRGERYWESSDDLRVLSNLLIALEETFEYAKPIGNVMGAGQQLLSIAASLDGISFAFLERLHSDCPCKSPEVGVLALSLRCRLEGHLRLSFPMLSRPDFLSQFIDLLPPEPEMLLKEDPIRVARRILRNFQCDFKRLRISNPTSRPMPMQIA